MISKLIRAGAASALFAFVATDAASAGIILPAPGPMIGAGAPALALFGAGYWLLRRRRRG
jgi:lipopolysaccharide export LptBFGC system permease protein LptF